MSKSFRLTLLIGLLLLSSGCAPRGETKSVQEVLDSARSEYVAILKTSADSEPAKGPLLELSKALETLASANGASTVVVADSAKVADALTLLVKTAGYTSRASLGEIIMQHRVLSGDAAKGDVNPARVKLLVARTYGVLASEFETTKFSVKPIARPS